MFDIAFFQVLRGWVGTSWATFSNIFSGMDFGSWFYDSFRTWGSSRSSKDDFLVRISMSNFTLIFDEFQGVHRIPYASKVGGDLPGSGAAK